MVFEIPYEFIERVFGTFIAQNFNKITTIIFIGGLVITLLSRNNSRNRERDKDNTEYEETTETQENWRAHYAFNKNKWSASGWIYNEETKLWVPPDYLSEQSKVKWRWDEKKQIWIDQEKEERLARYHEFRKSQGKEPTYEEWKAAREAEQNKDKSTN